METERLTSAPQADIEHELATDSNGDLWLVWQGFRDGRSDILARRHDGSRWSAEETVSASPANDWTPAVAACGDGSVYVAWDTYDQGNYDVLLRRFSGDRWGDVAAVAETPKFEAHVSVACDGQNRLWAAWNESGFQWGKDSGFEIYKEATRIYEWRTLAVAAWDGVRWQVPAADVNELLERLFAAWPTDNRDSEEYLFNHSQINAATLPAPTGEATPPRLVDPEVREYHTYPVHPNEAEDVGRIRAYTIESEGRTYKIFLGDTHRHTEFSHDGLNDGSLMEAYRYALDAAELDFLGVSEHNNRGGQDTPYVNWLHPQIADIFRLPGSFVPVYTYERSISYPDGHRNILSARRGIPTLPITEAEQQHEEGAVRLFAYLREHDAISIPHTSATGMGTDWRDNDPEVEPLVNVIGTARIEQIDIVRDQTFLYNRQNLDQEVSLTFVDSDVEPGEHYYYVRVIQKNREIAWSSPIWVTVE